MPDEPLNPVLEGAVQMHEMFLALVEAGFTEDQAVKVLVHWVRVNGQDGT